MSGTGEVPSSVKTLWNWLFRIIFKVTNALVILSKFGDEVPKWLQFFSKRSLSRILHWCTMYMYIQGGVSRFETLVGDFSCLTKLLRFFPDALAVDKNKLKRSLFVEQFDDRLRTSLCKTCYYLHIVRKKSYRLWVWKNESKKLYQSHPWQAHEHEEFN